MNEHRFIHNAISCIYVLIFCLSIYFFHKNSIPIEGIYIVDVSIALNIFHNVNFLLSTNPPPYDKCKLCNFTSFKGKSSPNSSERDIILSFGANKLPNLFPFIKTLRTTGSRCRFILFVNAKSLTKYPDLFYQSVIECGVEFINFGSISFSKMQSMYLRFCFFQKFLKLNRDKIDRVIMCDLYDTIFQHDPFTSSFGNSLYVTSETYAINRVPKNMQWIKECFSYFDKFYDPTVSHFFNSTFQNDVLSQVPINGGLQAGPIDIMIDFTTAMMKMGDPKNLDVHCNDQGFLSALVLSGFFDKMFNVSVLSLNSEFMGSFHFYCRYINSNDKKKYEIGNIDRNGGVPAVLHQFDRSRKLRLLLLEACPNENNFTDYIRGI